MVEQQLDEQTQSVAPLTIGSQLQEARQEKKLSEGDVATELRISKSIISHIELEQWDQLPARTYARGYFANYVRFLGLPYEDMMAQFDLTYSVATRQPQLTTLGSITETKSIPWLSALVVVGLAVVLWFAYAEWQQSQQLTSDAGSDQMLVPETEQTIEQSDTVVDMRTEP